MGKITIADIWSVYVKPSLNGRTIFRKKGVNRRSERVKERNREFAKLRASKVAKYHCLKEGGPDCIRVKNTYVGGERIKIKICKWGCFEPKLRQAARGELQVPPNLDDELRKLEEVR